MKKALLLTPLAVLAMASCTDNEFLGSEEAQHTINGDKAISFESGAAALTRADITGAKAAELLGKNFVVEGTKGLTSVATSVVFDHYNINWTANTANTTESNVADWEYVGISKNANSSITSEKQTIKYWDYSQSQYDFIAYSLGTSTGVAVSKVDPAKAVQSVSDAGEGKCAYSFTGTSDQLAKTYIADLVTVKKADYGKTVTPRFRQLGTKVRVAIYETVPGYAIRDVEFYSAYASNDAQKENFKLFASSAVLPSLTGDGVMYVYYPTVNNPSDQDNNKAHVKYAISGTNELAANHAYGALQYNNTKTIENGAAKKYLGESSVQATYALGSADNNYIYVLPNEAGTALTLRVNYTLVSEDGSGETIVVKGAKAVIPSTYTEWKSNYAYTYIFKISDNTNGTTGVYDPTKPDDSENDPEGLHPITFDAVVMNYEDGIQETVTTVATPSITTYSEGVNPTAANEYKAGVDIYVQVMTTESTPTLKNDLATEAALYTVTKSSAAYAATEAEIMDALTYQVSNVSGTITGRNGVVLAPATMATDVTEIVLASYTKTVTSGTTAKFTSATGNYAFVYTVAAANPSQNKEIIGQVIPVTLSAQPTDWSTADYYTDAACTAKASTYADGTYYQKSGIYTKNDGTYAVKVIKVQ